MKKLAFFAFISGLSVMGAVAGVGTTPSRPIIKLATEPALEKSIPAEQLVRFKLQAIDSTGNNIRNAKIRFSLLTPPSNPWFSSDFPVVEGTQLVDLEAIAPDGRLKVEQVLPIRGQYQLLVEVTPIDGKSFDRAQQTFALSVPENPVKYRNLAILAAVLLATGFAGGWVIGKRQPLKPGEIAPQRVRLLLSGVTILAIAALLAVNISAELVDSHGHTHESDRSTARPSEDLEVQWLGDTHATVGQMAPMGVLLTDKKTGKPVTNGILKVKATQLEHNETVFAYQVLPDLKGKFQWQQQFFDGATHQVEVEVLPPPNAPNLFTPFQIAKEIEVAGVAPPLSSRFVTLAYFTGILVLGLGIGLAIANKRNPKTLAST